MDTLTIPEALKGEFATVESLWTLEAETRRVDSLILTWVKYEKQARRLFTYLVLRHPAWDLKTRKEVNSAIIRNKNLYTRHCLLGVEALGGQTLSTLMGSAHLQLSPEVARIQKYRNKIFHGQLTGQNRTAAQLSADVHHLIAWINALAVAATDAFGYNGLERKTHLLATSCPSENLKFPFDTSAQFDAWLRQLTRRQTTD